MSQFRTTEDLKVNVLKRCGEATNGNSRYGDDVIDYLTKIQNIIISGGNIFDIDVDEVWSWAKAQTPIILNMEVPYSTGGVTLTQGSASGTFSVTPTSSFAGWHLRVTGTREVYKLTAHTAGQAAFSLDMTYLGVSLAAGAYTLFKLDYELTPQLIYIGARNNTLDFEQVDGGSPDVYAATIANGAYTPSALASALETALNGAAVTDVWTVQYSSATRKFNLTSDLASGGSSVSLLGASGTNVENSILPSLGFNVDDSTGSAGYSSPFILGGISRLVEPFVVYGHTGRDPHIYGIDSLAFAQEFPLSEVCSNVPRRFAKIDEDKDGRIVVRFNSYPTTSVRIEISYVPVPHDLVDNSVSTPLVPRKFIDILEFGAAYFLLVDKEDDKADKYATLAKLQLQAMRKQNRSEQFRESKFFGSTIPREDNTCRTNRRRLRYGYTADE